MRLLLALGLVLLWILVSISTVIGGGSTGYIDVTITGEELAPSVGTLTPVIGTLEATLRGNVINDYGLDIIERGFNFGENPGVYTDNWSEAPGPWHEGIFTYLKNPLVLGHTYYYRAYAISSAGTGYGTEVSFTLVVGCPSSLNVWKINQNLVGLTWTKGSGTDNTFIVRKIGSYPVDRTDGVEVYNGTGDNTTDSGVDFGYLTSGSYYYRAWGWSSVSGYTACYTENLVGGEGMLIMSLILFCGLLTGLSGWKRFLPLAMAASIAWLAFGILALTSPSTIGVGSISETWVQAMGFALVLMIFVPVLLYIRPTTTLQKTRGGISWTEQGGLPKDSETRGQRVKREYKEKLRKRMRRTR